MQDTEKEPRLFLWTNRVLLISGVISILYALVIAFFNLLEACIFFLMAVGMFFGRSKFNQHLEQDVDKFKIRRNIQCKECEGSGYSREYMNAWSYGLSDEGIELTCQDCGGSGKTEIVNVGDCGICHGSGMVWSGKRKISCECVLRNFSTSVHRG